MMELVAAIMPDGRVQLEWTEEATVWADSSQRFQKELYERWQTDPAAAMLWLGFADGSMGLAPSVDFWRALAAAFIDGLRQIEDIETLRHRAVVPADPQSLAQLCLQAPAMAGGEYLNAAVLASLWEALGRCFADQIKAFAGTVADFCQTFSPHVHLVGRVYFHLVENKAGDQPFAFMATYSTRMGRQGKSAHAPLKQALTEYAGDHAKLLSLLATVHRAARTSAVVERLLSSGELFHPLAWSAAEAFAFLKDIPVCESAGILCRIPDWWKKSGARVQLTISLGERPPSQVGLDALLTFQPCLAIGDTPISIEEARHLLENAQGLVLIKNRWVAVDPDKLRQTVDAYEKAAALAAGGGLSFAEAMRLQLQPEKTLAIAGEAPTEIVHGQWLAAVLEKLRRPDLIRDIQSDKAFAGSLRAYQADGLKWLGLLHGLQLGACLADDMGLGKTVQVLALLSWIKARAVGSGYEPRAHLLVVPASLVANWESEIKRFCPHFKVFIAHPDAHKGKALRALSGDAVNGFDLVITTYSMVADLAWLKACAFDYVLLDEAQAIKNPATRQARAVKQLTCRNRLVLTGTPIENRLADLWSLFDFLNPGLLGGTAEFKRFCKGLADHPQGYGRLRRVIGPYILRRMKTDKAIISDLPEKVEMKTFAGLSKKQIVLYRNLVEQIKAQLAVSQGIQRRGVVLSALMKFKQICNHPDHYMGTGPFAEADGGKFACLREICETIGAKRERVLVFTQFKEMADPLAAFLHSVFGRPGLVLHGAVAVKKRKDIVAAFQAPAYVPFMVLSLKAGGVGLNLTAANHVIHFDRWWNPAVENQATDRAYRIGQHRAVVVHKLLTRHTVEEKIDAMLEAKADLSRQVIAPSGEAWITELGNDQLVDLFRLSL